MTLRPGSVPSRAVAAGLLLFVMALIHTMVVSPTIGRLIENRENVAFKRALLWRLISAASNPKGEAPGSATDHGLYCSGPTDAVVLAVIQGSLQSIAITARTPIRSAQPLPRAMRGSLEMVGISIDISGEPQDILKVIHGIEGMTPALFIQKAALRRQQTGSVGGEGNLQLEAQIEVYCALRPAPA